MIYLYTEVAGLLAWRMSRCAELQLGVPCLWGRGCSTHVHEPIISSCDRVYLHYVIPFYTLSIENMSPILVFGLL